MRSRLQEEFSLLSEEQLNALLNDKLDNEIQTKLFNSFSLENDFDIQLPKKGKFQILLNALTGLSTSGPITLVSMIAASSFFLPIVGIFGGACLLALNACNYRAEKLKAQIEDENNETAFKSLVLKHLAANVLMDGSQDFSVVIENLKQELRAPNFTKDPEKIIKKNNALKVGMMTGLTLLGYYFAAQPILFGFGFALAGAAMLGPIGLGIALASAICFSAFCAYKSYQSSKQASALESHKAQITISLQIKKESIVQPNFKRKSSTRLAIQSANMNCESLSLQVPSCPVLDTSSNSNCSSSSSSLYGPLAEIGSFENYNDARPIFL